MPLVRENGCVGSVRLAINRTRTDKRPAGSAISSEFATLRIYRSSEFTEAANLPTSSTHGTVQLAFHFTIFQSVAFVMHLFAAPDSDHDFDDASVVEIEA